jgi:hypothetical protein
MPFENSLLKSLTMIINMNRGFILRGKARDEGLHTIGTV